MDTALIVSHETQNNNSKNRTRTITAAREGESLTSLHHHQKLMRSAHYLSSSLHAFHQTTTLGSQGVLRGFPFTSAQWQELQRQALIFKHFMASVPVPPDLLLPSSAKCFPEAPPHLLFYTNNEIGGGGGCYRFSAGGDPEPGRCRRTDGKKWRCSRDVEPGMKYCERHVHRGRPRSRKPVELLHKTTTKLTTTTPTPTPATAPPSTTHQLPVFKFPFQSMEPPAKDPRYAEPGSQEWELMHLKMELGSDPVLQHYEDQYSNYTTLTNHCYPFLNPDLSPLEDPPRSFIDAWSSENSVKTTTNSVSTAVKLPLSTLTLSMSGIAEETDQKEMGLSLSDIGIVKSQTSTWMGSGGPLAEVLHNNACSSSSSSRNSCGEIMNLMGNGSSHELSPEDSPVRPVSSPSGVLQKALASLSDSSSISSNSSRSSPTLATTSKQEMALQWLNQSNK